MSFLAKSSLGKFIFREILQVAMTESHAINTGGNTYFFSIANPLLRLRAETFLTKEPETLEWIDRMNDDLCIVGHRGKCRHIFHLRGCVETSQCNRF